MYCCLFQYTISFCTFLADEYKVKNLVMFSIKNLKYQIIRGRTEKLMERFVGPYRIKKIVLLNMVELELLDIVKIYVMT